MRNVNMRTIEQIQADIHDTELEIERAMAEMRQLQESITEEEREQDQDGSWKAARLNYINNGDMSGINDWYTRRELRKQGEAESRKGKDTAQLVRTYDLARNSLEKAIEQFGKDSSPAARAAIYAAQQELYAAEYDLKANGLGSVIRESDNNTPKDTGNTRYSRDMNGIEKFKSMLSTRMTDKNSKSGKYYYSDAEFDADEAWLKSMMEDTELGTDVTGAARTLYDEMRSEDSHKMGRYYRESTRKQRDQDWEKAEADWKNKVNAAGRNMGPKLVEAQKDGHLKGYKVSTGKLVKE